MDINSIILGELTGVKLYSIGEDGREIELDFDLIDTSGASLCISYNASSYELALSAPFHKCNVLVSDKISDSDDDIDISSIELDSFLEQFVKSR